MQRLIDLWSREPVRIVDLCAAVLVLIASFGVQIDVGQQTAILGVVSALIIMLGGEVARSQVSSPATVAQLIDRTPQVSSTEGPTT
jgi:hypothetical protein